MGRFPLSSNRGHFSQFSAGLGLILLAGCAGSNRPPAVQIRTVEVVREVMRPCAVTVPQRPEPLARPLPTDAVALAAVALAKLAEWSAPGKYGERADAALRTCTKP